MWNGLLLPGAGAGVGIFAPGPGNRSSGNTVIGNTLSYNGLPGVTMHNHAAPPMTPAVNLNDNAIIGNTITRNAADTEDAATPGPAGINIYSVAPVTGVLAAESESKLARAELPAPGATLMVSGLENRV